MADIEGSEMEVDCLTKVKLPNHNNLDDSIEKECSETVAEKGKDMNANNEYASDELKTHIDNKCSDETSVKKNDLNKSLNLRFGIEAILRVKAEVTDKLRDKNTDTNSRYGHLNLLTNDHGQIGDNELDGDISADSDDDGIENDDVRDTCLSHVRLPASFQGLRQDDNSYFPSQNIFSPGRINLDLPWSPSILNDIRKDRFGPLRRIGHPYQNRTPPKRKKPRTSFTRLQILELEKRFERQKYLASSERSSLAKMLKMSDAQVKTWFQNRRTKWRRQTAEERELERQAANRLLLSFQSDPVHRKSMVLSPDRMCLSQLQRFQEERSTDI